METSESLLECSVRVETKVGGTECTEKGVLSAAFRPHGRGLELSD